MIKNKKKDKENVHSGHRQRLLKTAYEGNFNALSEVQQVEVLLFFVLTRVDTNPIAHRLLDNFGSFSAIIDADVEDLKTVDGISDIAAIKIKMFPILFNRYTESKIDTKFPDIKTTTDLYQMVEELLRYKDHEETLLISFDSATKFNGYRCIARGDGRSVGVELKKLYQFIDSFRTATIVIAHNHPEGKCSASATDIKAQKQIALALQTYHVKLFDNLVVGDQGIYSIKDDKIVYKYNREAYKDILNSLKKNGVT